MPAELSWDQVRAWRMQRHHLVEPVSRRSMIRAAADLCGVHAQLFSSAELTLWNRVEGLSRDGVRNALWKNRSLVKTWAMRGTLHLLPARDYWRWQGAVATYDHFRKPAWSRAFGVTQKELDRVIETIGHALEDQVLTRDELADAVGRATRGALGDKVRESWGSLLKPAAFQGRLCFGPEAGRNVRFTNPRTWLARSDPVGGEDAMLEATRAFLRVNGPATREDLVRWWAGITPARAARQIQALGDEVEEVAVGGEAMWMLRGDAKKAAAATGGAVRLVPAFDQYVIAATEHAEHYLPGPFRDRIYRDQGWRSAVILVDGRMDGIWRHERKGTRLEVELEPFIDLAAGIRRKAEQEAERLAAWFGMPLDLRWA